MDNVVSPSSLEAVQLHVCTHFKAQLRLKARHIITPADLLHTKTYFFYFLLIHPLTHPLSCFCTRRKITQHSISHMVPFLLWHCWWNWFRQKHYQIYRTNLFYWQKSFSWCWKGFFFFSDWCCLVFFFALEILYQCWSDLCSNNLFQIHEFVVSNSHFTAVITFNKSQRTRHYTLTSSSCCKLAFKGCSLEVWFKYCWKPISLVCLQAGLNLHFTCSNVNC